MNADAIIRLFKEAYGTFPPLKGKPTNNNLLAIRETLLPFSHGHRIRPITGNSFPHGHPHRGCQVQSGPWRCQVRQAPLYNKNNANDAMTVVCVCAKAAHKSHLDYYTSYKAAKCGVAKFLRDIVDKIWYNDLKDAETFYTKVTALEIMAYLDTNSGGLHAIDMISLRLNMTQYYIQADGIPQFIIMMEDAKKKAKRPACPSLMLNW
jgi:hypothetical protein